MDGRKPSTLIRRGFTLVELLVVIAIIGLLVAMLMPALSMVTEAARRMQCRSNLKQLGVALLAYHGTHGVLPAAAEGGQGSVYFRHTGFARLYPYLDQQTLFDEFNFDTKADFAGLDYTWAAPANTTAIGMQLELFLCPSNRRSTPTPLEVSLPNFSWSLAKAAVTDYLFSGGADRFVDAKYWSYGSRGAIGFSSTTRLADIVDGTSNTMLMGESAGGLYANRYYAQELSGSGVGRVLTDSETGQIYRRVCFDRETPHPIGGFPVIVDNLMHQAYGRQRSCRNFRVTVVGGLVARTADGHGNYYPPNDCALESATDLFVPDPPTGNIRQSHSQQLPNFRSTHSGMIHVLMADGSVDGIDEAVDGSVMMALSTTSGGEVARNVHP